VNSPPDCRPSFDGRLLSRPRLVAAVVFFGAEESARAVDVVDACPSAPRAQLLFVDDARAPRSGCPPPARSERCGIVGRATPLADDSLHCRRRLRTASQLLSASRIYHSHIAEVLIISSM